MAQEHIIIAEIHYDIEDLEQAWGKKDNINNMINLSCHYLGLHFQYLKTSRLNIGLNWFGKKNCKCSQFITSVN